MKVTAVAAAVVAVTPVERYDAGRRVREELLTGRVGDSATGSRTDAFAASAEEAAGDLAEKLDVDVL
jgi:hypothetical protein